MPAGGSTAAQPPDDREPGKHHDVDYAEEQHDEERIDSRAHAPCDDEPAAKTRAHERVRVSKPRGAATLMTDDGPNSTGALASRLAEMGLASGGAIGAWSIASIDRTPQGDAALVAFVRGRARVDVRLEPAAPGKLCFARIGDVHLSHLPVEAALSRHAGELMRDVVARVEAHVHAADLRSLLEVDPGRSSPAGSGGAYASESEAPDLAAALKTSADRPFMRFLTLGLDELAAFPDALRQMYDGTLGGLVIKGIYSKAEMVDVMSRLNARDAALPRTSFPARFKAHFYGRCLDGADPALDT